MLTINDLKLSNRKFWTGFFATSFPTALDEETDMTLSEMMEEQKVVDVKWWEKFTKYYNGVLEETDGYVDNPRTVICELTADQTLKIEFYPADTVYYINDRQIACTGGEYHIQIFPLADLVKYTEKIKDYRIFLLLLPLTVISSLEVEKATGIISDALKNIFDDRFCGNLQKDMVAAMICGCACDKE